jgi:polysaccharide biosynthesis protein PslJ
LTTFQIHPSDLEPSRVDHRTYLSRRRFLRMDAALVIGVMICLLDLIPARLIVPSLTDVGRPAMVLGLLMCCWWLMVRLNPRLVMVGPQPIRWAALVYVGANLISYAAGFLRGLNVTEANGADRALLAMAVFLGVVLMTADGITNWERLKTVLRVFIYCSAFMAAIGLFQFIFKVDLTQYLEVPGLQEKGLASGFEERGAGIRVASTAIHYIEFSVCMGLALPFAIHLARFSPTQRQRRRFLTLTMLIAVAIPMTISRTGIVAMVAVLLVMMPVWGWRMRYNVLIAGVGLTMVMMVAKPGLMGTIRDMFLNADQDTSIQARTERYGLVGHFFAQRPWLGRGTGTWLAPQYQILDNQWLSLALSNGLLGVAALATLHLTAISLAWIALRRATTEEDRHLCGALISTQFVALLVAATFDSLSFTTFATTIALMIGLCGTVWRFTHPARTVRTSHARGVGQQSGAG